MGSCCSIKKENNSLKKDLEMPDFYYIIEKEKTLYKKTKKGISSYSLKNKIKLKENSSIGYLSNDSIMIVGGRNSAGSKLNFSYMLGLNTYKIEELASLPYPVEGGQLNEYKE